MCIRIFFYECKNFLIGAKILIKGFTFFGSESDIVVSIGIISDVNSKEFLWLFCSLFHRIFILTEYELKQANRFYWVVKGMLIPESWGPIEVEAVFNSYMYRIWGNHEAVVHEDGFEEAWQKRLNKS